MANIWQSTALLFRRGWPHEAAVNGTGGAAATTTVAQGARKGSEPSLHVTFGIESAISGTYESLLHHALEVASMDYPELFGFSYDVGGERNDPLPLSVPWLQLLHICVHDVASRDSRLRR